MSQRETILDPTGKEEAPRANMLAPRPARLDGLRLGLLDNGKPNAATVLAAFAEQLRAVYDLGDVVTFTKGYFGTPVEEPMVAEIAERCDLVIAGVGD